MFFQNQVYIRLDGRLGNQLFQLALALRIQKDLNVNVILDDYLPKRKGFKSLLFKEYKIFHRFQYGTSSQLLYNRIRNNYTLRKWFPSSNLFVEAEQGIEKLDFSKAYQSYSGFFQSPKVFPSKDILIEEFSVSDDNLDTKLKKLIKLAITSNSLAISVRRGDFLNSAHLGVCSDSYYLNGITVIEQKMTIDNIFIFSDDLDYCKELFRDLGYNTIFVAGFSPAKALYLMSQCKSLVIPNSTFSWWGAWLDPHGHNIVVAPDPWNDEQPTSDDFIPTNWLRLTKHPK